MLLTDILKKNKSLAKFKVSEAPLKSNEATNPFEVQRNRFLAGIHVQLDAISADKAGIKFEKTATIKEKDGSTTTKSLRFKRWFEKTGNEFVVVLRYGPAPLFDHGIRCKSLEEVEDLLTCFIDETMPIRLRHTPTTCGMYPVARI